MEDILGINSFLQRVTKEVVDAAKERIYNNNSAGTYIGLDEYNRAVVKINGRDTVVGVPSQIAGIPRGKKVLTDGVGTMSTGDATPPLEKVEKDGETFTVVRHYFQVDRQDGLCIALEISISISDTTGKVVYEGRIVPVSSGAFLNNEMQIRDSYQEMNNPNIWLSAKTGEERKILRGRSNYAKGAVIRAWDFGIVFGRGVNNELYEWYVDRWNNEPPFSTYILQPGEQPPGTKFDQSRDVIYDLKSSFADFTGSGVYGSPQLIEDHSVEKFLDPKPVPDQEGQVARSTGVVWGYGRVELESTVFTRTIPATPLTDEYEVELSRLVVKSYQNGVHLYTNVYYIFDAEFGEFNYIEDSQSFMTGRWDDPNTVEAQTGTSGFDDRSKSFEARAYFFWESRYNRYYTIPEINAGLDMRYQRGSNAIFATVNNIERINILLNGIFETVFGGSTYTIETKNLTDDSSYVISDIGAVINYATMQRHDYKTIDFSRHYGSGRASIGYIPYYVGGEHKLKESERAQYYPNGVRSAIKHKTNNDLTIETTAHYETEFNISGNFAAIKTYICNSDGSITESVIKDNDVLRNGYLVLPTNSWEIYGEELWTRIGAGVCPFYSEYDDSVFNYAENYPLLYAPIALYGLIFSLGPVPSCKDMLASAVFPALWENWRAPRAIAGSDKQNEVRSIFETTIYFDHELTDELLDSQEELRWVEWTTLEFEQGSYAYYYIENSQSIAYQSPDESLVPSGQYQYSRAKGGKLVYRYGLYEDMIADPFFNYTDEEIKFNQPLSGRGPFVLGFTKLEEEIPSWYPSRGTQPAQLNQGLAPGNGGFQFTRLTNTAFSTDNAAKATVKDTDIELAIIVDPQDGEITIQLPIIRDDTELRSNSATILYNTVNNLRITNCVAGLPLPIKIKEALEIPDIVNRDGPPYTYRVLPIPLERYPDIAIYFGQETKGPPILLGSVPLSNVQAP